MRKLKKALSVLMVSALIMATALNPGISVLAEESADTQAEEVQDALEVSEEDTGDSADAENLEESGEDVSEDETQEDVEDPDKEQQETEIPDKETETPDAEQEESGEESQESSDEGKKTEDPEAEEPDEGQAEEKPEEGNTEEGEKSEEGKEEKSEDVLEIIKGVRLALNEYSEEELKSVPLSVVLSHLQDGDGNFLDIAQDVETVWILVKDGAGSVVLDGKYARTSGETLDLSQFVNVDGYTMEVTVGSGEKQDVGNKQYVAEMNLEAKLTSLLPLQEVQAYLILNGYSDDELKAMPLSQVLDSLQDSEGNKVSFPEGATTVWAYYKDEYGSILKDEYHAIDSDATVDLTTYKMNTFYSMELIVGSGKQLDPGNIRYIVSVYVSPEVQDSVSFELYVQNESGSRTRVVPLQREHYYDVNENYETSEPGIDVTKYVISAHGEGEQYFLEMQSYASRLPIWKVDVYDYAGYQSFQSGNLDAPTITDQILTSGVGYQGDFEASSGTFNSENNLFILVYKNKETGAVYGTKAVGFMTVEDSYSLEGDISVYENQQAVSIVDKKSSGSNNATIDFETGRMSVSFYCDFYLKSGYSRYGQYYVSLNVLSQLSGNKNSSVVKAVKGFYDSSEAAADQEDIHEQLLSSPGYITDFSRGSAYFTLFLEDNSVLKVTVWVYNDNDTEENLSDIPVVGKEDPWFRITGAKQDGTNLNIYVVRNDHDHDLDTMYGYGYMTVLVDDDVDLTRVVPEFESATFDEKKEEYRLYFAEDGSAGTTVDNGVTEIDFSKGPVQFIFVADRDGIRYQKNYIIEFKRRSTGSDLYVYGPRKREIFLDEYFEYKHDILIANMGDEPLTGLRVELEATNCALDDYWTVGGEKNETLAPFSTTSISYETSKGELPNLAKITLRPDVDELSKDGEIDGTLTIYADNQEPVVIELTGTAQNPKITTESLYDGVKYVPYSCIITTNNMHDWLDVSFELKGDLPSGLEWIPETAEIYGVPLETGEFPIKITANFTCPTYRFTPSTAELTLTILDNTNENVYNASDEGYRILDAIGEDQGDLDFVVTELSDDVFRSSGELGEFIDLWLNGQKLTPGVDYAAESGSTRITLFSQTFEGKVDRTGRNTLAAEFRVAGDKKNELKRTAQNFRIDLKPTEIPEPTATPTPEVQPTEAPKPTAVPQPTTVPQPTEAPQPTTTPQPTQTPAPINYVNCAVRVTDQDGNPLATRSLEMHSDPVSSTTDVNGLAGFGHVEFGSHTVYIKDGSGNVDASKGFTLQQGVGPSVVDDVITASAGSSLTIEMKYANGVLSIQSVQNGIKSKVSPATGDESNLELWMLLLIVSLGAVTVLGARRARR